MSNKTYSIKDGNGAVVALVEAGSKSAALRHTAEKYFKADLATAADGMAAAKAGLEVETAGAKASGEAGEGGQQGQEGGQA